MKHIPNNKSHERIQTLADIAEEFFRMNGVSIDYQKICDVFARTVDAKYCVFNLMDFEDRSYKTVAISGAIHGINEASKLFGFDLKMRTWPRDLDREEFIKDKIVTECSIIDLVGKQLSKKYVDQLIAMSDLGESCIVKISNNNELLGDFTVIMDKDNKFDSHDEAVLFTRLLGMIIIQKRTKKDLETSDTKLDDVIEFLPDATFALDSEHRVIIWNKAIETLSGIKSEDIIGKGDYAYTLPFYGIARPHLIDLLNNPNEEIESKYLDFKRGVNFVSGQAFANCLYEGKGAWIYAKASPLHDNEGNIIGTIEIIRDISEQKFVEEQLKSSEERFENLFRRAPLGYQSLDEDGMLIEVNDAWSLTLGYESIEIIGKWFGDLLADECVDKFRERFPIFKAAGKIHCEFRMKHKSRDLKYIAFEGKIGYKRDGSFDKTHCIIQDITERKLAEEKLIESEQTHKALFDFSGVGIAYYSVDGRVISYNNRAAEHMGGKPEDFVDKSIYTLFPKENADEYNKRIVSATLSEKSQDYEDSVLLPSGHLWFFSTYSRILDASGKVKGIQIISQDISDIKNNEAKISYLSYHDQLTGLFNRRFFDEELARLDSPRNYPLTLAMGDVNGLKMVNDSFGHKAGDELLIRVANVLKKACRQDDIIARVGGDEFSIILPGSDEADAEKVIQRINKLISTEKVGPLDISISFGYETKLNESESIESLIKKTEDHMYRHKVSESSSTRSKTIALIMSTLFEKNKREKEHSDRVSQICVDIATAMNMSKDEINHIRTAGLMHDIGKIGIEENILNSKFILSNSEWLEIKKHPEIGFRILSSATEFSDIAEDVFSHHERWDGKGYPRGLKEESISVFARIITIADSFDAMISERPYRTYKKSMNTLDALHEIRKNAGSQFDPSIARVFVEKVMMLDW